MGSGNTSDALVTAAYNALSGAQTDAMSVGGYVIAAVGILSVISIVLKLIHKA